MMTQLKLLVLKTLQADTLRDFYTRLGFSFVEEQHGNGPVHYSAPLGDGILELYPLPEGTEADSSTRLGFGVADLPAVIEELGDLTEVSGPKTTPWGLRAVVKDPDGRSVELYGEVAE
ncbi:VOC family protein [Rubripirellula reticaptiva]|uniref:Glyoxalase-like domain protein n=1 Tax=Rubripirellula reticaptiva TaxID=2528013 RepID=A0A5C6EHL7_9BACT|nr:VOC family protein [Rubripirellula reticaptiva]TWU49273.1 Glyoxalase-like domain protein [Rubripirellula reticaptiva]